MEQKNQLRHYVHMPENEDIGFPERAYRASEERLEYKGREVLYLIVECSGFTCCSGNYTARLETARVVGYITRWKYKINEKGEVISEIEPIEDKETQGEVRRMLRKERMLNANF